MSRKSAAVLALVVCALAICQNVSGQAPSRQFAPGVLNVIPPTPEAQDMFSGPVPLAEIPVALQGLDFDPKLFSKADTIVEQSKSVTLRRTVWMLEFAFKPMRMIYVDVPQGSGRMQRKLVWYMVYRVRNLGGHLKPKATSDEVVKLLNPSVPQSKDLYDQYKEVTNEVEVFGRTTTELRFFPHFVLASLEYDKEYLDKVIPAAQAAIKAREFPGRPNQKVYDSLSISEIPLPVSGDADDGVWGVVTWTDIDPRIDYFVVYVQGLTNAYRFEDPAGAYKSGDPPGSSRKIFRKSLQLNFWRPGDTVDPNEEEIRFGCRMDPDPEEQQRIFKRYGVDKPIDYTWVYR
jgi:hypothetical protein